MSDHPNEWRGELARWARPTTPAITLRAPIRRATSSGAGAFLALGDDGNQYWVKVPGNPQGNQVLVNEVIVEEIGRRIGAPVRERILVSIPPGLTQWNDFPVPVSTSPLIAHGSLHVPSAEDSDKLQYTRRDGNAQRQASLLALWDLCVGEDPQWLYETTAAYSIWSYDHGLWFTTGEGDWDEGVLQRIVALNGLPSGALPLGLDSAEFARVAQQLEQLSADDLLAAMAAVPVEWGSSDHDLESMAWFIFSRREAVASRMRDLSAAKS